MRKVTRTYFSKRLGKIVTKTYTYGEGKSRRGLTLVGKDGKITPNSKKNVLKFKESIDNNPFLTRAEKITLKNKLDALIKVRHDSGKKLTTTGFYGWMEEDKVNRLLVNAGYTAEELADEVGVDVEDILNPDNWKTPDKGNTYFQLGDTIYDIKFNYTSSILVRRE